MSALRTTVAQTSASVPRLAVDIPVILAGLSACTFLVAISPALVGGEFGNTALASLWRLGQIGLIVASFLRLYGLYFDSLTFRIYGPWLLLLALAATVNATELLAWETLIKTTIMILIISVLVGSPPSKTWDDRNHFVFFFVLLAGSLVLASISAAPFLSSDWSWDSGRLAKTDMFESGYFAANTSLFIVAVCLLTIRWKCKLFFLIILSYFLLVSTILATRTPAISAVIAVLSANVYNLVMGRLGPYWRRRLSVSIALTVILVPLIWVAFVVNFPDPDLSRTMAGRPHLWQAGVQQWLTSPVFGNFSMSQLTALDAAYSNLIANERWEIATLYELISGGFHNIWIQTLAMYGIVGFSFLFYSYYRIMLSATSSNNSTNCLAVSLLIFGRSFTEYSGPFTYSNAALDFICMYALVYAFKYRENPRR